jgi:ABC-type multidrug transport system fused ATPase/permease subunit
MRVRILIVIPIVAWSALLYQVNPLFLKWQVDSLTQDWRSIGDVQLESVIPIFVTIIVGYLLIKLVDAFLQFFKSSVLYTFDRKAEEDLEGRFKDFAEQFDSSFLSGHNNMRLLRNLQSEARTIRQKFSSLQSILIELPVGIIALSSILPILHPILLIVILASALVSLYVEYSQSNAWRKTEFLESRYAIQTSDLLHQMYTKIDVLVTNGWLKQFFEVYKKRRSRWNRVRNHQNTQDKLFDLINAIINALTEAATTIIGGLLTLAGMITIGTFTVLALYVERVKNLITNVGDLLRLIIELRYILIRLDYLLLIQPKLTHQHDSDVKNILTVESIDISNISFAYPEISKDEYEYLKQVQVRFGLERKKTKMWSFSTIKSFLSSTYLAPGQRKILKEEFGRIEKKLNSQSQRLDNVLNDISCSFSKGNIYQLEGGAGSGKSTLVNILKHSLEPDSGTVTVHYKTKQSKKHVDYLSDISYNEWKNLFASVVYDTSFWSSISLKEVLSLGIQDKNKITDAEMLKMLKRVNLAVPSNSLDNIISESVDYSDGERILLGFARLLLDPKPVIIIDESVVHVKGEHLETINEILQELKQTSIIIIESSLIPEKIVIDSVVTL